jgi:hypothetical protein
MIGRLSLHDDWFMMIGSSPISNTYYVYAVQSKQGKSSACVVSDISRLPAIAV